MANLMNAPFEHFLGESQGPALAISHQCAFDGALAKAHVATHVSPDARTYSASNAHFIPDIVVVFAYLESLGITLAFADRRALGNTLTLSDKSTCTRAELSSDALSDVPTLA